MPAERQADGLERCFPPLFGREERRRDQPEPLAELTGWIAKSIRLDPRSEDTKVLLPELADQVAAAEQTGRRRLMPMALALWERFQREIVKRTVGAGQAAAAAS